MTTAQKVAQKIIDDFESAHTSHDIDSYAQEVLYNVIDIDENIEITFTSDGFIIENHEQRAAAQMQCDEDVEVAINKQVYDYLFT